MYNILQPDNRERWLILYYFLIVFNHPKLEDKLFAENTKYTLHLN